MANDPAKFSDALVVFGVTGDLSYKMIFPALYRMTKKGVLDDRDPLDCLLSKLRYLGGNYNDPETFKALKQVLDNAWKPEITASPPAMGKITIFIPLPIEQCLVVH